MDNYCWGMPIAPRAPPKAMRGKCERGHPFSTPGLRFHGVDRADVFNNIRVRASRCGECALNPPPSQHLPRRRPTPVPAQRHTLPEHFRSPTQPRRTPADRTTHSPPKTSAPPRTADAPRRLRDAFLADRTTHSPPKTSARPHAATHPPRALPLPHATPIHARRLRDAFPADRTTHSPQRRPAPRSATRPPPPFRFGHKKTAPHSACAMPNVSVDRRCGRSFGLVSRALFAAVAGRWRVGVGLRPQPWALRSRRCGRVLRA